MKQTNLMTKTKFILAIMLCILWLTACTSSTTQTEENVTDQSEENNTDTPPTKTRTRLIVGVPFLTRILDGQQAFGGGPASTEQIGQALIRINPETGELIPDLAESWTFSDDNKTLTVTLPANATYSNGNPLDAQAVADALLRNKEVSPYASDFEGLTDVKVVDATTLELIFSDPPAAFLTVLNSAFGGPWNVSVAKEIGNEAFATAPIASGPFMVKEFTAGNELLLVRNENYQTNLPVVKNHGPLHLEEILVRVIPEEMTLVGELETGAIDLTVNVPASAIDRLRNNPEINLFELRQPGVFGLLMNLETPLFSDVRVRQAIAKALDREDLAKVLSGVIPVHAFITEGMIAYDPKMETYAQELHPHDIATAQALLAEAGWTDTDGDGIVEKDGEPFTVAFLIPTNVAAQEQASQVIQNQLKTIGIDVQISQQDPNYIWDVRGTGDYDMAFEVYAWPDPDILFLEFAAEFRNHANYNNPKVFDALVAARYIMDPAERKAAYTSIQQQLLNDVVAIPLWQGTYYVAARTNVQGLVVPESYKIFLNDVTIVE